MDARVQSSWSHHANRCFRYANLENQLWGRNDTEHTGQIGHIENQVFLVIAFNGDGNGVAVATNVGGF